MHDTSRLLLAGTGLVLAFGLADRPAFAQAGAPQQHSTPLGGSGQGTAPHTFRSGPLPVEIPKATAPGTTATPTSGNPASLSSRSIFDRWGNLFVEKGELPHGLTAVVLAPSPASGTPTGTINLFSLGSLQPGVHELRLNGSGTPRQANVTNISWSASQNGIIAVLISLLLPALDGRPPVQVSHVYPSDKLPSRVLLTTRKDGTTINWGDGTPTIEATREGIALPTTGTKSNPGEALGRVIFVGGTVKF